MRFSRQRRKGNVDPSEANGRRANFVPHFRRQTDSAVEDRIAYSVVGFVIFFSNGFLDAGRIWAEIVLRWMEAPSLRDKNAIRLHSQLVSIHEALSAAATLWSTTSTTVHGTKWNCIRLQTISIFLPSHINSWRADYASLLLDAVEVTLC